MATTPQSSRTTAGSRAKAATAGRKAAATRKRTQAAKAGSTVRTDAERTARDVRSAAEATSSATRAETRVRVTQVRQLAERSMNVPVGVGLVARDNLVSTVRGLAGTLSDRGRIERELSRYERRGASARNRFERQVRRTRTSFERGVRHRRSDVTKLMSEAQHRIGSIAP
jgi:hypothetical protein